MLPSSDCCLYGHDNKSACVISLYKNLQWLPPPQVRTPGLTLWRTHANHSSSHAVVPAVGSQAKKRDNISLRL